MDMSDLAISATPHAPAAAARADVAAATPRAILLADTQQRAADALPGFVRLLEREGLVCLVIGAERDELDRAAAYAPDIAMVRVCGSLAERIELLYRIRASFACPVVMLTASHDECDELIALEAGFDDVWVESSAERLLVARMRAQLRRAAPGVARGGSRAMVGGLSIDREAALARFNGRTLELTPAQLDALFLLAAQPGRVVDREHLQRNGEHEGRAVDVMISRLRLRLAHAGVDTIEIRSVQRRGYKLSVRAEREARSADARAARRVWNDGGTERRPAEDERLAVAAG
jgi:DNA-binding response OmpR family regulator